MNQNEKRAARLWVARFFLRFYPKPRSFSV